MCPLIKTLIYLAVLQVAFAYITVIKPPAIAGKLSKLCVEKPAKEEPRGADLTKPIGDIKCGEVVAYLQALSRYYGRRCQQMGIECRDRDIYPTKWFDKVSTTITGMCQKLENYERAARAVGKQQPLTTGNSVDVKPATKKCKPRNSI